MKSLPVPKGQFLREFKEVVDRKQGGAKKYLLSALIPEISQRYRDYHRERSALESLGAVRWNSDEYSALKSCYENSQKFHSDLLKKRGIQSNPDKPDPVCPYCQVDHARTWDHFLPSIEFPEFFIFSPNLIRVCSDCNGRKLAEAGRPRLFLNPFFDNLSTVRYLKCDVGRLGPRRQLVAKFSIDGDRGNPQFDAYVESIAKTHFVKLGLARKFRAESSREISSIFLAARQWLRTPTHRQIRDALVGQVRDLRKAGVGENDRGLVLRESLIGLPRLV